MSGGGQTISTSDVRLGGLQIQNTGYGVCIPIVYGTGRVKPNLIEYTNFVATPHTTTSGAGGKGVSVNTSNTTYTYTAAIILGICEGPVAKFGLLWLDKNSPVAPSIYGLSLFSGTYPQSAWAWMQTYNPSRAIGYQGIAYAASGAYNLGSNASIGNHSFEITGTGTLQNGYDVNVVDVVADFLNNANYGAGFPFLGDTTAAHLYCQANGIFISPVLDTQKPAHEWLTQFARISNTGLVWSDGLLKVVPYGDQAVTGNGATYTPNVTPIYDLTDDDFIASNADPIIVTRKRQADAFNAVQVEYLNRNNYYNIEPADVKDQANIEAYGLRSMTPVKLHEICVPTVAKQVAQAMLQRELYIRNTYTFDLSWKYCLLEPMDIVSLTDDALGLNRTPVRIVSIEENYDGLLTVVAEEMPYGVSQPAHYPHTGGSGYTPNQNVAAGPVNTPVLFEPPNVMSAPNLEVWMAVSGGVDWGGCDVWVSEDNATYRNIGRITNPARHGVLSASIAAGIDPDTTHTLSVDLTASRSQLLSGTQADADSLKTLMWVDGELMSYQTATLTAPYRYDLSYLRRGVNGTTIGVHAAGAQFARLDDAIFRYVIPTGMIGLPVWVKFASFNPFGGGVQSLADCVAYNYTITGNRPVGLAALNATGGMFLVDLAWTFGAVQRDRDYTEIIGSTTNNRATAVTLTASKSPTANWKHTGLTPGQAWYYWARTVDNSGNTSDWYPSSATGGIAASPSADPSALLTQLQSAVGMGQMAADLAAPIAQVITPANLAASSSTALAQANSAAQAALQLLLKADALKLAAQKTKWITDATSTIDPATGKVTLLATAQISTDVQAQLNQVGLTLGAIDGTVVSHTASLASQGTRISATETSITQLQGSVALKASSSYVDSSVANVLGVIDPAAITASQNQSAIGVLQTLLDNHASRTLAQANGARASAAERTLTAVSDAVSAQATERLILAARVDNNLAALQTEASARATADTALSSSIQTLSAQVNNATTGLPAATAAIQTEASARATADTALSSSIQTLSAQVNNATTGLPAATAAIQTEASARATADTALSSSIQTLSAQVNNATTGLPATYSAVQTAQSAIAGIEAKYAVKVDVNGHVTGFELIQSGAVGAFSILADKFLIARPDGSGTPVQLLTMGMVNGINALGLNGNLIADGSIVARSLAVTSLSAVSANLGTVTSGRVQNAGNTNYLDLNATGAAPFLKVGNNITIDAAGNATFNGVVLSRNMIVAQGTTLAGTALYPSAPGASAVVDTGIVVPAWDPAATYVAVTNISAAGGVGISAAYYPPYPEITTQAQLMHTWRWTTSATIKLAVSMSAAIPGNVYSVTIYGGVVWTIYRVT